MNLQLIDSFRDATSDLAATRLDHCSLHQHEEMMMTLTHKNLELSHQMSIRLYIWQSQRETDRFLFFSQKCSLDLLKRQKSGKQRGLYLLNWMFEDVMMDANGIIRVCISAFVSKVMQCITYPVIKGNLSVIS